ncbi:MAG: hypothetical protein AAF638_10570 [Pseudomonadota bacterium]
MATMHSVAFWFDTSEVIARRMPMLWAAAFMPQTDARREVDQMVTEKWAAATEVAMKLPNAALAAGMESTKCLQKGNFPAIAAARGLEAAFQELADPTTKRVARNRARLRKS